MDVSALGSLSDQIKCFFASYASTCLINPLFPNFYKHAFWCYSMKYAKEKA